MVYVSFSTSGIIAAILMCVKLHQMKPSRLSKKSKSILLLGRDSHKSAFDGIGLSHNCDGVILPTMMDDDFHISFSIQRDSVVNAISQYGDKVNNPMTNIYRLCD